MAKQFHPNLRFIHDRPRENISFLGVTVVVNQGDWNYTDGHRNLHF